MFLRRTAALVLAVSALLATPVAASAHHPSPACARTGDLICPTPRFRTAVHRLAKQPAMVLPGQWERPDGRVLVRECVESYPNTRADRGRPNDELMTCLTEPDPRRFNHHIIALHRAHLRWWHAWVRRLLS